MGVDVQAPTERVGVAVSPCSCWRTSNPKAETFGSGGHGLGRPNPNGLNRRRQVRMTAVLPVALEDPPHRVTIGSEKVWYKGPARPHTRPPRQPKRTNGGIQLDATRDSSHDLIDRAARHTLVPARPSVVGRANDSNSKSSTSRVANICPSLPCDAQRSRRQTVVIDACRADTSRRLRLRPRLGHQLVKDRYAAAPLPHRPSYRAPPHEPIAASPQDAVSRERKSLDQDIFPES